MNLEAFIAHSRSFAARGNLRRLRRHACALVVSALSAFACQSASSDGAASRGLQLQALWQQSSGASSGSVGADECDDRTQTPTSGFGTDIPASVMTIQIRYRNLDSGFACCVAFAATVRRVLLDPVDAGNAEVTLLGYPSEDDSIEESTPRCEAQSQGQALGRNCGTGFASPSFRSDPKQFVSQPETVTTVTVQIFSVPFLLPGPFNPQDGVLNPEPGGSLTDPNMEFRIVDARSDIMPESIQIHVGAGTGPPAPDAPVVPNVIPVQPPAICDDCEDQIACSASRSLAVSGVVERVRPSMPLPEGAARLTVYAKNRAGRESLMSYPFTVLSTPTPTFTPSPTITPTPTDTPCSPQGLQSGDPDILLLSVTEQGQSGAGRSNAPAVNEDGSVTAFSSNAADLVPTPGVAGQTEVYVRAFGLRLSITRRVSVGPDETLANGDSQRDGFPPGLDTDGTSVTFSSAASNLVSDDTNAVEDIFVSDLQQGFTFRASIGSAGDQADGPSRLPAGDDAGRVVFESSATNVDEEIADTNGVTDVFLYEDGVVRRLSVAADETEGNGASSSAVISVDGSVAAFVSAATNLVPDDTNAAADVFVVDLDTRVVERVSVSSAGQQANGASAFPKLSRDGRIVAFESLASNLVAGDTNDAADVFVHDRSTGLTERISVDSCGHQSNGSSAGPAVDGAGGFVSFVSSASNLVPGDTNQVSDVFVFNRRSGSTARVSVEQPGNPGAAGNAGNLPTSLSANGCWIGFASEAENLVSGDVNGMQDAFLAGNPFSECATPTPTP